MVKTAGKIFWIVLLMLGGVLSSPGADDMSGSAASLKNFALPEYSRSNGRLQFILYGETARNLGALVFLTQPKVDIVRNEVSNILDVVSLADAQPYPLTWTPGQVADFWKDKKHSQGLIFADSAEYDKNLRMLRGDAPVHYRSREMSVDGVGFDADQDHKFVHVRSKVRVVIYPNARRQAAPGAGTEPKPEPEQKTEQKTNQEKK
ncbi:MAG: hypothetical protein J5806_08570 [Lentisphaeria bacterium]|nr:hypothetical protein [Lentisphaeria bacterium]